MLVALVAVVVAGARCKRSNGAYCDDRRPCPSGFACDTAARECNPATTGGPIDMAVVEGGGGCAQCAGTTPICVADSCVSCLSTSDGEGACAAVSPATPHCSPTGACVGCRNIGDCGGVTPFCDATTHVCRGCVADAECPSLICDLTPGSTTHGVCIAAGQVVYADGASGNDGNSGLSPLAATRTVGKAVNIAVGLTPARGYVHVAAGSYSESVGVNNKTIYIVGADGAIIHPTNQDGLGAQSGGSLTVRNLVVTATNGNGGNCQSNASFTAYRTQFINSAQLGVFSSSCQLLLDACWIHGNSGGGVSLNGSFTILNSIITKNGGAGGVVQVATGTTMVFANDTVADNVASASATAGVNCAVVGPLAPVNTILYNNRLTGGMLAETNNCSGSFDANDDASAGPQSTVDLTAKSPGFKGGTPVTADSYHLTPGSPCLNEASPLYAPDHDYDFARRPDAASMKPDIGAVELQ